MLSEFFTQIGSDLSIFEENQIVLDLVDLAVNNRSISVVGYTLIQIDSET